MSMNGTDISAFQPGDPNLGTNRFGWVKATEGVGWESPVWRQQIAKLRALHDGAGYYHLANGHNTPEAEARYFWGVIGSTWQVGEPVALDAEPQFYTAIPDPVGWSLAFSKEILRLTGLVDVFYSDWDHLKNHGYNFQPLVDFGCGLWGAAYNPNGYGDPSPWPVIFCWQDSDRDESSGGDDDVCYGDLATWRAYGTPAGVTPQGGGVTPIPSLTPDQQFLADLGIPLP